MAKYQKYAEYKASGVEWLGGIPSHWECKRLKDILIEPMKNGLFKKKDQFGRGSLLVNVSDLYVSSNFIQDNKLDRVETTKEERETYRVKKGDLFFVRSSLKLEGIGRSACYIGADEDVVFECHIVNAKPKINEISSKFLTRYLNSYSVINEYVRRSKTTTMTTIDQNSLATIAIVVPPRKEQIQLDSFLDYELDQIQSLIAKQEKLIELLKEKRQAVISHAVTKGLNPNVPMKDSGVEWIGETPIHWQATYVGIVSDVIDPQPDHRAPAISEDGEGFPYIGIRDVNKDGTLNFETARPVEESAVIKQEHSFTIEPHNIIFCKVGTLGLPRKIIPHGRCALSATLVLIKAKKINSQFLLYALDSDCIISQTNFLATGSTRAALGIQQIRKFRIPLPSVSDQLAISSFLDQQVARIDTLIIKAQSAIQLMQERRTALISAAVTGKIDVRDWQHPNQKNNDNTELSA